MTNELYGTEKIDFKKIRESINQNVETIKSTSEEIGHYLTVDEKLKLSVLPEYATKAHEIRESIADMRRQNKQAESFMSFVCDLLPKYGVDINMGPVEINGQFVEMPIHSDIEIVSRRLNVGYTVDVNQLKKDFANDKMTSADFEQQKKAATAEHEAKISKLKELDSKLNDYINSHINIQEMN